MTKGSDGKTIDGMSMDRINKIILKLKDHSYKPNPSRRKYIKKQNGKLRPLGISSVDDKLVQEIVRMILESIFESTFSSYSHGFRPNRSCHTALKQIQITYTGVKWFVEGDIRGYFDNINHHTLVNLLRRRINDEYFISLIWKFLKAGYLEDWKFHNTYSGTPQGSIISPVLANIYLHELDEYMEEYKRIFNKGKARSKTPEYKALDNELRKIKRRHEKIWNELSDGKKKSVLAEVKRLKKLQSQMQYSDPLDPNYKRIVYCRYADDFLVGIIGSKEAAEKVKVDIKTFLETKLQLELSDEKTLITNAKDAARFLGYDIRLSYDSTTIKDKNGVITRSHNGRVKLYVPKEKWLKKLLDYKALKISRDKNNNEIWIPTHRSYLINNESLEILRQYNWEIRGLYNYYRIANNASVLNKFDYVMEYSLYKTFAAKYKSSISKIKNRFDIDGTFAVRYSTSKGEKVEFYYNKGFRTQKPCWDDSVDNIPRTIMLSVQGSLIKRMMAGKCEVCGADNKAVQVHHVRKLKELEGTENWERLMISKKRKTLILCESCHLDLHT